MSASLPYQPSWRDRLAYRVANAVLRTATPTYRALLRGTYLGGFICATNDCPACHPTTEEKP